MRELLHHRLDRLSTQVSVEVWADDPGGPTHPPAVTLWFDEEVNDIDLTPTEARALAALLILAAETQERKVPA